MPYKNIEDIRIYDKKKYAEQVRDGKCVDCGKKALYPFLRCQKHRLMDNADAKKRQKGYRARLREEGRCEKCSRKMIPEDKGYKSCVNCRLGIFKPKRSKYATIIVQPTV